MFEDSLLDTAGGRYATLRRRGPLAPLASFTIEAAMVGVLLVVPLIFTEAPPRLPMSIPIITYSAPKSVDVFTAAHPSAPPVATVIDPKRLIAPGRIPTSIDRTPDVAAPNPGGLLPGAIRAENGGSGGDAMPGFIPGPGTTVEPRPEPRPAAPQRIIVSSMSTGMLVFKVQPVYPPLARMARVSGAVQLHAIIGRDGTIQNLSTLSGHPMLVPAAVDAVRQWRYRPYLLNGEPVEVETQVTVNFTLGN